MTRRRMVTERDKLRPMFDDALKTVELSITCRENPPHQSQVYSAWKLIGKFVPDLKAIDHSGDIGVKADATVEFK